MAKDVKPENPWGLLLFGVLLFAIGAVVLALGDGILAAPGLAVMGLGAAFGLIGAVAIGIEMGMARHEWHQRR